MAKREVTEEGAAAPRGPVIEVVQPLLRQPGFLFGLALFAAAAVALAWVAPGALPVDSASWAEAAFFLALGLFTIAIGFPHPTFGHVSFDRVAQVSSVLVLGSVEAACIAGLASLLYPLHRLRSAAPASRILEACITNAGLMTLVVLGAGSLYEGLGGPVPLQALDLQAVALLLLLILAMQVLNELGMAGIYHFRNKKTSDVISLFETLTELVAGLVAVLVAIVYTRMETEVFVLLLLVLAAGMLGLKQFADMRRRLEQIVQSRTEALREKTEQLQRLATHDMLTGLRNRRAAEDFLRAALDQAERDGRDLCVALADIDHFKQINDGLSHAAGDRVLQQVARVLAESTRGADLVARYGGEEFLFCFNGADEDTAMQVCERLRRSVEALDLSTVAPGLKVSVSIGLAARNDGVSADALVDTADACLYRAKRAGRNCVVAASTAAPAPG